MTSLMVDRLHSLGWQFITGVEVEDAVGRFSLLTTSFPEIVLRVSWAWIKVVASAVAHRPSFAGLENIDPAATRRFLLSLPPAEQGLFRKALNGAHFTQDALCHWSTSGSTVCEFCGGQDSRHHRFWECSVFDSCREHCTQDFWDILPGLPACLTLHGWALRPSTWTQWVQQLLKIPVPDPSLALRPFVSDDNWIDIFSDGSCLWPKHPDLKVASWALVQAHPSNDVSCSQVIMAGPVPGLLQSAYRSELIAVQQAIKYAWVWGRKVRIWSDCQSVVGRLQTMLTTRCHADVWQMSGLISWSIWNVLTSNMELLLQKWLHTKM